VSEEIRRGTIQTVIMRRDLNAQTKMSLATA